MESPESPEECHRQTAAALGLLQRLPPQDLETDLDALIKIAPHLEHSLAPYVTRPLKVKLDPEQNRYFVACDYNCDGSTHRSPWSGRYCPSAELGEAEDERLFRPSERLRRLEETFNEVFDAYTTSYYEGSVSSVYLWDLDEGFAGAFLVHKELSKATSSDRKGVWDAVHVIEVKESANSHFSEYKLSSTVLVHLEVAGQSADQTLDCS
ncbi:unnamed protein product [Polarella glacialis]|uniref:F-actin-capping protein subunit beta n=1 Tax=Polarella glacialis TaxID=89957 RepID=A0A813KT42_POLGL|nr:unnamed protein product [Polarella glacialis]